jgi:hypothetical protein
MTHPDLGVPVIDQKSSFARQAKVEPALHVHENHGEDDSDERGEQFASIGQQCSYGNGPHAYSAEYWIGLLHFKRLVATGRLANSAEHLALCESYAASRRAAVGGF